MSANHAPQLSQLVHAATPNLIEAEKATLKVRFVAASAALVTEARCLPDDKEELWEEKVIIDHLLGGNTADGPAMAEANKAYKRWVAEEIAQGKADKDMWMGEEASQVISEQGVNVEVPAATAKMLHVEVTQPAWKHSQQMITESKDEVEVPKVTIPPRLILHKEPCIHCLVKNATCMGLVGCTCDGCACMKQGCEKLTKLAGKRAQVGTLTVWSLKTAKAGSCKRVADDNDDDEVEVVKSHMHTKGKALVHVDQLAEALDKIGVE
ncbi:hypothetical protein F5J12DRAFT_895771 [Pisolithus orientalis]|uniref:uncharacterized protein n=1 Tax=Pisolithus orientalis TaxID=936130 RepID=UPI002225663A|nr:uncharacterized protein F5J12DRAFT_895771 [Pisolithus orientalis]KAI5997642.1 hypothetical protein F5J12DRAFT_895771 [Pisolithus orientalis]